PSKFPLPLWKRVGNDIRFARLLPQRFSHNGLAIGVVATPIIAGAALFAATHLPWDQFVAHYPAWLKVLGAVTTGALAMAAMQSNIPDNVMALITEFRMHKPSKFRVGFDDKKRAMSSFRRYPHGYRPNYELAFIKNSEGLIELDPLFKGYAPPEVLQAI